jgi:acyl dehydratase
MASSLASRSFSLQDQIAFAKLSSDWNPMHLDQAFARRTQVGAPVVHAIHNLAWAADAVLRAFPIRVANIRARFLQPLYLDEAASVRIKERTDQPIEFEIVAANVVVAHAKLSSQPGKIVAKIGQPAVSAAAPMSVPADLGLEQLAGQAGAVSIPGNDAQSLFPALTDVIGASGVKALLATSQIVGMACLGTALAVCRARHYLRSEKPRWATRQQKSMRGSAHCRSILPAVAQRAGWTRSRALPCRPNPARPKYQSVSPEARLRDNDRL